MPNYSFRNITNGEEFILFFSNKERVEFLEENKGIIIQTITKAPGLGDPVSLGRIKPDQGFRDVLREIKKSHPRGGGVNTF